MKKMDNILEVVLVAFTEYLAEKSKGTEYEEDMFDLDKFVYNMSLFLNRRGKKVIKNMFSERGGISS